MFKDENTEFIKCLFNEETGNLELYEEPFATIECKTEEDFENLKVAFDKQRKEKPIPNEEDPCQWYCPCCKSVIGVDGQQFETDYCCDCGKALDWDWDIHRRGV